jgi:phosphatidylserine/phosphatidylglycerophosphate/cardiolipin synthase-like enzyme
MRYGRRSFLALGGGVVTAGSIARSSSTEESLSQARTPPRIEPIFSYPTLVGGADDVHEETVRDLLKRAVPGSTVHLTIFTLARSTIAEALIAASNRGVDVNVIIAGHYAEATETQRLLDVLGDSVSIASGGSIGTKYNHNKFLLLSKLSNGETDVVWQSSTNFTRVQRHRHNTSVVFREDTELYDVYRDYWDDLAAGETDRQYNRTEQTDSATVFFSPRSDFDTHLKVLNEISPTRDATVRFMYSIWTTGRLEVVDRIEELVSQGCSVEVIIEEEASTVGEHLRNAGAAVLEYPHDTLNRLLTLERSPNVHSKNMLIDANFNEGGETVRRKLVYTGSQNLSKSGLVDNDEVLLRIEDANVYDQFVQDWKRVYDQGNRLTSSMTIWPTIPGIF